MQKQFYETKENDYLGLTEHGPYETGAISEGKTYAKIIGEIIDSAKERYGLGV